MFASSISEHLLAKALDHAAKFTTIYTPQDRHIIMHAKKSLFYHSNSPKDQFDVTMGSYDEAETCELTGAYMLSLIAPKLKEGVGLYRDNGLAVCSATPKQIEKTKQQLKHNDRSELENCKLFRRNL